ncbi:helix-turn-helix transcriptional regulator [Actinocorallia aurantiaca]|uniref:DUF5919 domain-containing protein n=1 Tax=Actinocorallia aurantiaca TaxID=46204 RepID=A0ABN3UVX8_9ACTN
MTNDRLRDALMRAGLTPAQLAERVGADPKTAERWITTGRPPYPKTRYQIAALLGESESYLWPGAVPKARQAQASESELVKLYPNRSAVPPDTWLRLFHGVVSRLDVLVYSGLFVPELHPDLLDTLKEKSIAGAQVRFLLGDPDSSQVADRGAEEGIGAAMAEKIRTVLGFYQQLEGMPRIRVRLHRTTLYNSIYRFDDDLLVNSHLLGVPAAHAPILHFRKLSSGGVFDLYSKNFDRIWNEAMPAWPESEAV